MYVGQDIASVRFPQEGHHTDDDQQCFHTFAKQDGERCDERGQRVGLVRPQFTIDLRKEIVQLLRCGIGLFQLPARERAAVGQHRVFHFREKRLIAGSQRGLKRLEAIQVG
ncbi:Uncharacterised protein [Mycobacterium tuberculosis]|nr:Uncharacterised protein [Mycobacterium tuberculosis]